MKGGFKEVDLLSRAADEPVLSTPEIHGPLKIDSSHLFLLVSYPRDQKSKSKGLFRRTMILKSHCSAVRCVLGIRLSTEPTLLSSHRTIMQNKTSFYLLKLICCALFWSSKVTTLPMKSHPIAVLFCNPRPSK